MTELTSGGLTVTGIDSVRGAAAAVTAALADDVPARLVAKDHTLWGPEAEAEASIRLGWIDLPHTSRGLVDELTAPRSRLR
jgi:glucose-6-phosphate isomerase